MSQSSQHAYWQVYMFLLYIDFEIAFFLIELESFCSFDRDKPIELTASSIIGMCLNALKMLHWYFLVSML